MMRWLHGSVGASPSERIDSPLTSPRSSVMPLGTVAAHARPRTVHEPWRDYAFYMRRPSGIPPEPFRWLGYQLISRITGRSPFKKPE